MAPPGRFAEERGDAAPRIPAVDVVGPAGKFDGVVERQNEQLRQARLVLDADRPQLLVRASGGRDMPGAPTGRWKAATAVSCVESAQPHPNTRASTPADVPCARIRRSTWGGQDAAGACHCSPRTGLLQCRFRFMSFAIMGRQGDWGLSFKSHFDGEYTSFHRRCLYPPSK